MSTKAPTVAEKGARTRAANAEKKRQEDIAFISKTLGNRAAKEKAQKNKIWNNDKPTSRKRTSSTSEEPSVVAKKARETTSKTDQEDVSTKATSKSKTARKYAPPAIDIDSESEPEAQKEPKPVRIDFTNLPLPAKSKSKAASSKAVGNKNVAAPDKSAKPKTVSRQPARLVAESASEDDDASEDDERSGEAEESGDDGFEDIDDSTPNEQEFVNERPQITRGRASSRKDVNTDDSDAAGSNISRELDDVAPRKKKVVKQAKVPEELFQSDDDDEEKPPPAPKRSIWHQARPPPPRIDSDVEMDEAIADALVSIPLPTKSRRSSTASGWSSGRDVSIPDSEAGSDKDSEPEIPQSLPAKKISAARQKKADLEKPQVRPPLAQERYDRYHGTGNTADRPESDWDASARLVLPAPNKDIGLTAQHPQLQLVLRGSIVIVRRDLYLKNAFPSLGVRAGWARVIMIEAASDEASAAIKERLLTDGRFAVILSPIPIDRINIDRGDKKRYAVSIAHAMFKLTELSPAEIKVVVEEKLKDHRYIFPVDAKTGQMQFNLPFHHPAIKAVLKDQMFSSSVFKGRNYELLPARNPKHSDRREVADPMVALAATAVYASLMELRMTGERQPINFTEDAFEDIYRIHIKTLEDTRTHAPLSLHKVLHKLFCDVTATTKTVPAVAGSSATLINLVDVPDSD